MGTYRCIQCDETRHRDISGCNDWNGELCCDECFNAPRATLLTTDGEMETLSLHGKTFSGLRRIIGANLAEYVYLDDGMALMIDEEGLYSENARVNLLSSAMAGQPLVGNALLVKLDDMDGLPYQ